MNNHYLGVLETAERLLKDKDFTLSHFEALSIAAQIRTIEVISDGLNTHSEAKPYLEAVGMILGYKGKKLTTDILEQIEIMVQNKI